MSRSFLTARWCNIFLANYAVPAAVLETRLPPGLTLDELDGTPYVSLVAFQFLDTRVRGIAWPGHVNFPEVNLRFYVRRGSDRGVVFIREFVSQKLTVWLARALYNEPYVSAPTTGAVNVVGSSVVASYRLQRANRWNAISVTGSRPSVTPPETSVEHFFKEQHWGFGSTRTGGLVAYEVGHPVWDVYPVQSYSIDLDWLSVYGPEWAFLGREKPRSTVFAVGSEVTVSPKRVDP